MAFKLRSPINNKPAEFGSVPVAASSKGYAGYQSMLKDRLRSTAPKNRVGGDGGGNKSTGTFPDPQTGEKRYYDKAHQSYSSKTGLVNKSGSFKDGVYNLNKPKPEAKSVIPSYYQGGDSPFNIGQAAAQRDKSNAQEGKGTYKFENNNKPKTNLRMPRFSVSKYMAAPAGSKFAAATSGPESSSFPSKITSTTGGASNLDFSKGDIIGQYGKDKSKTTAPYKPGDGVMTRDAEKDNAKRIKNTKPTNTKPTNTSTNTTKSSKPTTTISTGSNNNVDKSGGYLKDTKNFSLGVDTNMGGNISKVQNVVSKARDAGHNLISGGAMSKRDRIRNRQGIRTENKGARVGQQIERIKGRQQRAGVSKDKGTDPGKFESQKKLDAFEKAMDSPKVTARTSKAGNVPGAGKIGDSKSMPSLRTPKPNQTAAKPSMKLNTSKQTSITIDDSRIKQGAKEAKGGKKVKASTYESLTGFKNKKGSSKGMRRGMSTANTSIKVPNLSRGPRA